MNWITQSYFVFIWWTMAWWKQSILLLWCFFVFYFYYRTRISIVECRDCHIHTYTKAALLMSYSFCLPSEKKSICIHNLFASSLALFTLILCLLFSPGPQLTPCIFTMLYVNTPKTWLNTDIISTVQTVCNMTTKSVNEQIMMWLCLQKISYWNLFTIWF